MEGEASLVDAPAVGYALVYLDSVMRDEKRAVHHRTHAASTLLNFYVRMAALPKDESDDDPFEDLGEITDEWFRRKRDEIPYVAVDNGTDVANILQSLFDPRG